MTLLSIFLTLSGRNVTFVSINEEKMFSAIIQKKYKLREVRVSDATALWSEIDKNRKYLSQWLPFVPSLTLDDERLFLLKVLSVPRSQRDHIFIIKRKRKVCGLVGFKNTDFLNHRTEIGYWLLPEYQHQGIMTACVVQLIRWAVEHLDINRIQIKCAVENEPSNAIPQRLKFIKEGIERDGELLASGKYTDLNVYSILKREIISLTEKPFQAKDIEETNL